MWLRELAHAKGWRTTISHPSNVKENFYMTHSQHLLSGIDTLVISLKVTWRTPHFLAHLAEQLEEAKRLECEIPFHLPEEDGGGFSFMLKPHGSQGHKFLLVGNDYALKIMDWMLPKSRPSIVIELKSELLWRLGPVEAVLRILRALERQDALIWETKPSRADLCMDVLFPAEQWNPGLLDYLVSYAADDQAFRKYKLMTGVYVGKGDLLARIYDKGAEISSGKTWFFDLWGIESLPEDSKGIRVEFQFRRPVLRELGINSMEAFFAGLPHMWAYCTGKWLQFQSNPGKHHTQREVLPWWQTVQSSFLGVQDGEPLIRAKAIESDAKRLRQQVTGLHTGIIALQHEAGEENEGLCVRLEDIAQTAEEAVLVLGKTEEDLREDVEKKLCKRKRLRAKQEEANRQRERLGLIRKKKDQS